MRSIEYKPFGKVRIKLKEIMQERDITIYALSKATAIEFSTIKNYCESNKRRAYFKADNK